MPLRKFIILLSALLVFSPVMSSFAMASQMNSVCHNVTQKEAGITEQKSNSGNSSSCHESGESTICQDSGCQCDACVSMVIHTFPAYQSPIPLLTNVRMKSRAPLDSVFAVVVPPPIVIL